MKEEDERPTSGEVNAEEPALVTPESTGVEEKPTVPETGFVDFRRLIGCGG